MSTSTQVTTFADLYTALMNATAEDTAQTATKTQSKFYINRALHDMHVGFSDRYPWAERRARLVTQATYTQGTVALNRGSTALTGTNTFWDETNENGVAFMRAGGKITINGEVDVYEIASVTDATNAVLTSNYVGTSTTGAITAFADAGDATHVVVTSAAHGLSNGMKVTITGTTSYNLQSAVTSAATNSFEIVATWVADDATGDWSSGSTSGASYVYFEDEYALEADFARPMDKQSFTDDREIPLIGRTEFRRRYPRNNVTNRPRVATIIDLPPSENTTPVRKVRLHPPPDAEYVLPYTYVTSYLATESDGTAATQLVNDTDEPIVPLRYRHAILFHALYHWYRDQLDDTRSQEAKAEYTDIMLRTAGDSEIGASRPKLEVRRGSYYSRARNPWRGNSGRFDIDGRFDRLEDRYR